MSTILPPPPTPQPLPTASPAPTIVTVSSPPQSISQLTPGTLIRADIVQVLARGLAEVQTDFGSVQIRTNLALAEGAKLELQLLRVLPQVQFAIRTVDGQTFLGVASRNPATPSAAPQSSAPAPVHSANAPSPAAASALQLGGGVAQLPEFAVGSLLRGTILKAVPSASGQIPVASVPQPTTAAPETAAVNASPPATPDASLASVVRPAGTRIDVRITGLSVPGQAQPSAVGSPAGHTTINGIVTALGANGRPIVETPLGLISLDASPNVRIGTQLQLSIMPLDTRAGSPLIPASVADIFMQSRSWPALEQATNFLALRAEGVQLAVQQSFPQPNHQLGAALLHFLNALKSGDARAWLGDAASILERERPDLAGRLNDDFAQLARAFSEAPSDDWRTALMPFLNGTHLEPVQLHIRGGKSQKGGKDEKEGSRFIIDIKLSRLGRVQLDGFIKKRGNDDKKSFDLIVRTERRLTQRMHRDIHRIFSDFNEAAGLTGAISFQARAQFVEVSLHRSVPAVPDGLVV